MTTTRLSLAFNLALALLCVFLLAQNRALKRQIESPASPTALAPGARVVSFPYTTLDGRRESLALGASRKPYLLFVVSTTCPWCERSLPRMEEIARAVEGRAVPLAVSIHGLAETVGFASEHRVGFELVSADSGDAFQREYGVDGVPTTILIGGDGVVRRSWEGDISERLAREIERAAGGS
jgi:peroxiredoxin